MIKRSSKKFLSLSLIALQALALAASAQAEEYTFNFSGNGITASGDLFVTPSPLAGTFEIYKATGTFSDSNVGISGLIIGVEGCSFANITPPFVPAGHSAAGFSFDNLFYPAGNSPMVCAGYSFIGGVVDCYGILLNVAGGYQVNLWSDGVLPGSTGPTYAVGDSLGSQALDYNNGHGVIVNVNTALVPGPGAAVLPAVFALGNLVTRRRKRKSKATG